MGEYSQLYMDQNFATGYVSEHGLAWHQHSGSKNAYEGAIPSDVIDRMIGWDPIQVPMSFVHPLTGTTEPYAADGGPQVVLRSDTLAPVGYNGGGSNLFTYREWFLRGPAQILDIAEGDLGVGFLGLFHHGGSAALQIEMAKTIVNSELGINYRPFLYAATSLNGSMKPQYGMGHTLMVCDNTFRMGQREAQKSGLFYSQKQTSRASLNVNDARQALQVMETAPDDVDKELRAMIEREVSPRQWDAFLDMWVPLPERNENVKSGGRGFTLASNKRQELDELYKFDNRVAPWAGTAFGVSQAVTTWAQHFGTVKGGVTRTERNKLNMITGKANDVQSDAMSKLELVLTS